MFSREYQEILYPSHKRVTEDKQIYIFLMRRVSVFVSYFLSRTSIHPNVITLFSILSGVLGAIAFAARWYAWGALGIFLWMLFDCADGEVARLTGKTSSIGKRLEPLNSDIQYVILLPSLSIGLHWAGVIAAHWVYLAFYAVSLYNIAREFYSSYPEKLLGKPRGWKKILIAVQFKNMGELRRLHPGMGLTFFAWRNIITQGGGLYPLLISISMVSLISVSLAEQWLGMVLVLYDILYLAFSLGTLLIILAMAVFTSLRA
jgi:phosphatidylglycerophosphate synthase